MDCLHVDHYTIKHWWHRYKCKRCGERFRYLPKNQYFETNVLGAEPKLDY